MVRHNLAANGARFLKCVWPFWDVMHWIELRVLWEPGKFQKIISIDFASQSFQALGPC